MKKNPFIRQILNRGDILGHNILTWDFVSHIMYVHTSGQHRLRNDIAENS